MTRETDVLVIGGGAIGMCAAYYLSEGGREVAVVDMGEICSGSSYGNAGLIVPNHCVPLAEPGVISKGLRWLFDPESPFYIKPRWDPEFLSWLWRFRSFCNRRHVQKSMPVIRDLSLASVRLFDELAAIEGLAFGYEKKGMILAFNSEKGLEGGVEEARLLKGVGLEIDILDAEGVREKNPDLRSEAVGGVYYPLDAHIIPDRFVRELARYLEGKGAGIYPYTEVLGFERSGSRIAAVKTTRGDVTAREVVLAGGAWSPGIARELGVRLPIQAAKGYSVTVARPPLCPVVPLLLAEAKVAVTPLGDTLRFAGTLELVGLDMSVNRRRVDAMMRAVPAYLPDIDPAGLEVIEIWRGPRPCTPDGLPFLGRSRTCENLTVAAGHAMIGISLAPVTGKLVSEVVMGKTPSIDLSALTVERFN